MPSPGLFLALLIVLDLIPVIFFITRIIARARAAGIAPGRYCGFALFVGLNVGMGMQGAAAKSIVYGAPGTPPPPFAWGVAALIAIGLVGSTAGAAGCYLYLRMRTICDPDYEELESPSDRSHIADVRQPRDRHDLGPE